MKQILVTLLLLSSLLSNGQKGCNLSKLSIESKTELQTFWKSLKESLEKKDTANLVSLCEFPFNIANEIITNNKIDKGKSFSLESSNIMQYAEPIFFEEHFKLALQLCDDPTKCLVFHGNYHKKQKTCGYVFCYMFKREDGTNQERCFSIIKVGSSYKLWGHWIKQF